MPTFTEDKVLQHVTVLPNGVVTARFEVTLKREDGTAASTTPLVETYEPGADLAAADPAVKAQCLAAWTPDVLQAWAEKKAADQAAAEAMQAGVAGKAAMAKNFATTPPKP